MRYTVWIGCCLWVLLLHGCAADVGAPEADGDSPARAIENAERGEIVSVAEVDLGYGTVFFEQGTTPSGDRFVFVREDAPAGFAQTPFGAMLAEQDLTSLEMFHAVTDREPPGFLLEAHAIEAHQLGRATEEVREASIDLDMPVAKSVSGCESWIYEPPPSGFWALRQGYNFREQETWLPVGDSRTDWNHHTSARVTFGACNDVKPAQFPIHSFMDVQVAIGHPGTGWQYFGWGPLDANTYRRWWNVRWLGPTSCGPTFCLPAPTRYAVGCIPGPQYCHLKSAERHSDPPR